MTTSRPNEGNSANAEGTTQGARAQVVLPTEYTKCLAIRLAGWVESMAPGDVVQEFHVQQAVIAGMRIEHSQANSTNRRIELAEIAADPGPRWDRDRKCEALALGDTLKRNPARVTAELQQTPAGRDLLLTRWRTLLLGVVVEGEMIWNPAASEMVIDLLGLPKTMRAAMTDLYARLQDREQLRQLILEEIAKLTALQADVAGDNAALRVRHCQGLGVERDSLLKMECREERAAQRQLTQALKAVKALKTKESAPTAQPAPVVPKTPNATKPVAPVQTPTMETVEVEVAAPASVPVTTPLKGNRKYRRKQQAQARHAGFLARRCA